MKPIDYRDFKSYKKGEAPPKIKDNKKKAKPTEFDLNIDKRWWALQPESIPGAIIGIVQALRESQTDRLTQYVTAARLYGNLPANTWAGTSYQKNAAVHSGAKQRITYNVCQSCVSTATSKIAKNKPKPFFLTNGGDYKLKRKAKKLGKFVDGCFYENNYHQLSTEIFKDAMVFGTGAIHVFNNYGRPTAERALVSEMYVDDNECLYGKPRQLHWARSVDRQSLAEMFKDEPEKLKAIMEAAPAVTPDKSAVKPNVADQIVVICSWHLPSGPDAEDGLYTMVIDSGLPLECKEYKRPVFPFAFFHWDKRLYGHWGQGAIEQIQNIQAEINTLLILIQRSMHLMGTFKVAIENTSKIVKQHLNNEIGTILTYTKTPPAYLNPPIVQPEIYSHLKTLKDSAYEILGISQLSAASKKPDGLDSGKALREYNDIESDRFMTVGQAYEQLALDTTQLFIYTAQDIAEETGNFSVNVPGKKFLESIKWKDVSMEEDQYVLKVYPVSSLPDEPAGKLQTVQEYMQAGLMSPRTGRRLLDDPDLEAANSLANAQEDWINQTLEKIIEEGVAGYNPPEPEMDLDLCKELILQYIAEGSVDGLEEEKLDLLRDWNNQVNILVQKAMPPPQPQQGPTGPQAVPAPPPVSQLMPNTPQQGAA